MPTWGTARGSPAAGFTSVLPFIDQAVLHDMGSGMGTADAGQHGAEDDSPLAAAINCSQRVLLPFTAAVRYRFLVPTI